MDILYKKKANIFNKIGIKSYKKALKSEYKNSKKIFKKNRVKTVKPVIYFVYKKR